MCAVFSPRIAPRDADAIVEVFLSATAKDLETERTLVQKALGFISAFVVLQRDWAEGAADPYTLSIERLRDTDAYLGVFGFRYGWTPPGQIRSVTELECEEAVRLWGTQNVPPIFWLLPEPGSDAERLLEAAAEKILEKEYADEPSRETSRSNQKAFHERLRAAKPAFITPFLTLDELPARAQACISNWNKRILKQAAAGPRGAVPTIPMSFLGAINRSPQRKGLDAALLALEESSEPGLCVAIHGSDDAGQFALLANIEQENPWNISGKVRSITPSFDKFDVDSLIGAALSEVSSLHNTLDALAAGLVDRSETESIVMFFPHVSRLAGGVDAFHAGFWNPLVTAARARRALVAAPRKPFIVVLALTSPMQLPLSPAVQAYDPGPAAPAFDFNRIILLPELEPFTHDDVVEWLKTTVGIKDLKERKRIADSVTKADGVPRAVFDRLNNDGFWAARPR
jgi:hypothetical protein